MPFWASKNAIRGAIRAQSAAIRRNPPPKTQSAVSGPYPPLGFFIQKRNPPGPELPYYNINWEKRRGGPPIPGSRFPLFFGGGKGQEEGKRRGESTTSTGFNPPCLLEFYKRRPPAF